MKKRIRKKKSAKRKIKKGTKNPRSKKMLKVKLNQNFKKLLKTSRKLLNKLKEQLSKSKKQPK
jgi:hypothetical protein